MNLGWFALTNLAGTLIWCGILAFAGQELGIHFQSVAGLVRPMLWVGIALALTASAVWIWRRRRLRPRPIPR
jgi:membrane protein DedA with SNARE-associated domain